MATRSNTGTSAAYYLLAENISHVWEYSIGAVNATRAAVTKQNGIEAVAQQTRRVAMMRAYELNEAARKIDKVHVGEKGYETQCKSQGDIAAFYNVAPGTYDEGVRMFKCVRNHGMSLDSEDWPIVQRHIRNKRMTPLIDADPSDTSAAAIIDEANKIEADKKAAAAAARGPRKPKAETEDTDTQGKDGDESEKDADLSVKHSIADAVLQFVERLQGASLSEDELDNLRKAQEGIAAILTSARNNHTAAA